LNLTKNLGWFALPARNCNFLQNTKLTETFLKKKMTTVKPLLIWRWSA